MSFSNYPPGVTGYEDVIAGPRFVHPSMEYCRNCDDFTEGTVLGWSSSIEFECGNCNHTTEIEDCEIDFEDDFEEYEPDYPEGYAV